MYIYDMIEDLVHDVMIKGYDAIGFSDDRRFQQPHLRVFQSFSWRPIPSQITRFFFYFLMTKYEF